MRLVRGWGRFGAPRESDRGQTGPCYSLVLFMSYGSLPWSVCGRYTYSRAQLGIQRSRRRGHEEAANSIAGRK